MADDKRKGNLLAFIVIGSGIVTIGISIRNWGLMGAGLVFIIIGVVSVVSARKGEGGRED